MLTLKGRLVQPLEASRRERNTNALAVRSPGDDFIVDAHAVAERRRGALIERQLPRLAALGGHYVNIEIAVVLSGEGDPFAVGRKFRETVRVPGPR